MPSIPDSLKPGDVVKLVEDLTVSLQEEQLAATFSYPSGALFTVDDVDGNYVVVTHTLKVDSVSIRAVLRVEADTLVYYQPLDDEASTEPDPPTEGEDKPDNEGGVTMPDTEYNRFSKATIKVTTKRPEVFLYEGALAKVGHYDGALDGWYGNGCAEATKGYQEKNGLDADGIIGKGTATSLIRAAVKEGFEPDLLCRIMSVIAFYEVSNRSDAYGMAENDIGDNAGANYGIMQCNSLGSVVSLLKMAGRTDLVQVYNSSDKSVVNPTIKDFFGSSAGIKAQNDYFENTILRIAMKELRAFGCFAAWENDASMKTWWERAVLLFCDSVVQNGTMWSRNARPFWKDLVGSEGRPASQNVPELYYGKWWDEVLGEYIKYEDFKTKWWAENEKQLADDSDVKAARKATTIAVAKDIITNLIPSSDPAAKLMVLAQTRSRSSSPKYWYQAVASRRVTDATGTSKSHPSGEVKGGTIDLAADYFL